MRAQGHSFQSIATIVGYADASGASKAYHRALSRKPAQNVNEIRQQESERLEYLWRKTADLIEHPTLEHSAIGKTIKDSRHPHGCTCGGTKDECFLEKQVALISAMREYRLQSESYRKMTGADLTAPKQPTAEDEREIEEFKTYIFKLADDNDALKAEVTSLRRQLEDAYAAVPAAQIVT